MKQPKKPPVKAKGRKGWGGRKKGITPHHPLSHHKGGKQGTPGGGGSGKPPGWKSGHKGIVPHHRISHHHPRKKRQLSPGSDVACCSAQALGTLLCWDWDQVLGLYWRTASDPDSGSSILATLEGVMPSVSRCYDYEPASGLYVNRAGLILGVELPGPHAIAVTPDGTWWSWGEPFNPAEWPDLVIEEAWLLCAG